MVMLFLKFLLFEMTDVLVFLLLTFVLTDPLRVCPLDAVGGVRVLVVFLLFLLLLLLFVQVQTFEFETDRLDPVVVVVVCMLMLIDPLRLCPLCC